MKAHQSGLTHRFDGRALWALLPEGEREEIGSVALEIVAAWNVTDREQQDDIDPRIARAGSAADALLLGLLQEAFVNAVARESLEAPDGSPRLPSMLGGVCRECGCTEMDACPPGCSWAEPDLCSACVKPLKRQGGDRR